MGEFILKPDILSFLTYLMKRILIILGLIILLVLLFTGVANYVSTSALVGRYVNNNNDYVLEGPRPISFGVDTLVLNMDNTFDSHTWGRGTYKVHSSIFETRIELFYKYQSGESYVKMIATSSIYGQTRMWLDFDREFYFEKVK